jgi:hypothetical protein
MALFAEAVSDLAESRDGRELPGFVAGEGNAVFWGVVDGIFRGFCDPMRYEKRRSASSSHKENHGQKWQTIVAPDSLASSLIWPLIGPVDDRAIWRMPRLLEKIRGWRVIRPLFLYGDPS